MAETIGQYLKQERERRNLTLEQAAHATHIRARHLEAIESDRLEDLPSRQSGQGFLRLYADYLGLDVEAMSVQPNEVPLQGDGLIPDQGAETQENQPEFPGEPITSPEGAIKGEVSKDELAIASTPAPEPSLSDITFITIGEQLRRQREVLGFSFDEVERHTHVRRHYLEALENGDFDHLPSSVQARGMLSNYARFLDMDADAILLNFAEGLQARLREKQPIPDQDNNTKENHKVLPKSLRNLLSFDVVFGGSLIILLVAFAIWGTNQVVSKQRAPLPASTLSISAALLETPSPASEASLPSTSSVVEGAPTPTGDGTPLPVPTALEGRIQITAVILERTWMRVIVDDKVEFEGRALPGVTYAFGGDQQIDVLTGNGSAVQIIYNQFNLGVMGSYGEIVGRIYTEAGVSIPTPTITPTPTRTKPATPGAVRTVTPADVP